MKAIKFLIQSKMKIMKRKMMKKKIKKKKMKNEKITMIQKKKQMKKCEEENNDESGEENGNNIIKNMLKGKEKWYCKKGNVPKPKSRMIKNRLCKLAKVNYNSEIILKLDLNENMYLGFIDIKELTNGNFILLFENRFYYINSRTFKILTIDESLNFNGASFSYIKEIN